MKLRYFGIVLLMLAFAACGVQGGYEQYVEIEDIAEVVEVEEAEETADIEETSIIWELADFADMRDESVMGRIHLYGEFHGNPEHHAKQLKLWHYYYHRYGMRHLFMEAPLFTAELLNIWMQEDNDDTLYMKFDMIASRFPDRVFYNDIDLLKRIKAQTPETVFHGTDIGHQHETLGQWFLQYLRDNGLEGSEQYLLTLEKIQQRIIWEESDFNESLRADMMVKHFVREFDALDGESIMSLFYGAAHVELGEYIWWQGGGPTMASQLLEIYGDRLYATDLQDLLGSRFFGGAFDVVYIAGRPYSALHFGTTDISAWHDSFATREFWRLIRPEDDFMENQITGVLLPHRDLPGNVMQGEVFVVTLTTYNGETITRYFRADEGVKWNGRPAAVEFVIDEG